MTDFSVQISKKTETTLNDETIADQHVGNTPSITTIYPITYPSKQDEKKRVRRRSIIRDFSLNTSTHGLPRIARSESQHNRLFWSISFIVFVGIMLYFIIKSIINYFNYPTQINVDIIREWPQYFPAFSICNACPFHLDQFLPAFLNFTYEFNLTNDTNASTLDPSLSPYILDFLVYEMNKN